jgi:hypothetical protein
MYDAFWQHASEMRVAKSPQCLAAVDRDNYDDCMPVADNNSRSTDEAQRGVASFAAVGAAISADQHEPISATAAPLRPTVHHWVLLIASAAVLLAALILSVEKDKVVTPWGKELPATCAWRRNTGLDCPGCGMTRCFVCLAHGDLAGAWFHNPAGLLVFLAVAGQIPYRISQIRRVRSGRPEIRRDRFVIVGGTVLVVALVGQWLWRTMGV